MSQPSSSAPASTPSSLAPGSSPPFALPRDKRCDPPDLIWVLAGLFVVGGLIRGGLFLVAVFNAEVLAAAGVTILSPLGGLLVIALRAVGFWHLLKLRRSAPSWLLAALVLSATVAASEFAAVGGERYLYSQSLLGLALSWAYSIFVVGYAFALRRRGVLSR